MESIRQELIRSFMGVGAMYVLATPLGLLTSIILARTLGPESFGQYVFVLSCLALLSLPVSGGLPQLLTREVAGYSHVGNWKLYRGVLRAAHSWVLVISLLLLTLYLAAGPAAGWIPTSGKWALLGIVVFLVPFQGLNAIRNGTIKGLGYPGLAEMPTQLIQPIFLLVAVGGMAFIGVLTANSALWAHVFIGLCIFIIASVQFIRLQPKVSPGQTPEYKNKAWLVALLPLTLVSLVGTFNAQIGILMLGLLGTDEAVAAMRIGERGAQFVALSLGLVNMVISPHIVRAHREGKKHQLQQLSRQSARGAILLALPVGLVLVLFGQPIIQLAFGDDYVDTAYWPMAILVFGQLFNVALGSVGVMLVMCGHEKLTLRGQLLGLAVTLMTAAILIPAYQAMGAAVAVAAGLIVWNGVMGYSVSKNLGIRPGIV